MKTTRQPIPGFWDPGPHDPIPIESTWQDFVRQIGGSVVEELVPEPRDFENTDFIFLDGGFVVELKEIETEFSASPRVWQAYIDILQRVVAEDPNWRPVSHGGSSEYPPWVAGEYVRVFRPHISRILKKANRQLRETKRHFKIDSRSGILLFANDGFTAMAPEMVEALAHQILLDSYSSIDCFVYLTVNRYVEIAGSKSPRLLWLPMCRAGAPKSLVNFVNDLGRKWFDLLDAKLGPFASREVNLRSEFSLRGARAIVLPGENRFPPLPSPLPTNHRKKCG